MDKDDKLTDHDYDGIKELDNDLPRWWLYLFYVTIVWGVLYLLYYHVLGIGYLSADEYKKELNPSYMKVKATETTFFGLFPDYRSPLFNPEGDITPLSEGQAAGKQQYVEETAATDTTAYESLTDTESLNAGHAIFTQHCVQCHGQYGEGNIGPNLTDNYWIHGGTFADIVKTIKFGVPAKGMISWRGTLKPEQIIEVASYVESIHGTNPPNPKAPQGTLVAEQ